MDIKAFIYHKRAEKYCDCQDYFGIAFQNNRIAVSDGMSQSIFPQWWAKILVDAFLETGEIPYCNIMPYQQQWQKMVRTEITKQESEGKNPWLLRDMFAERSGAGATLCGFTWNEKGWECQCLGDSSLIKVSSDNSIEIITSQSGQFDNHPDYLDSFNDGRGQPIEKYGNFDLKAILIVTDPFAELFQIHQDDSRFISERLKEIRNLSDHNSFVSLVEDWRDLYNMHNDDSTLVYLDSFSERKINKLKIDNINDLIYSENNSSFEIKNTNIEHHTIETIESDFSKLINVFLSNGVKMSLIISCLHNLWEKLSSENKCKKRKKSKK